METNTNIVSHLLAIGRVIRVRLERTLPLPLSQCETLRILEEHDAISMRALAAHFRITAPSATAIANELVRAELVTRQENTNDRREVLLHLTDHGKTMLSTVAEHRKNVIAGLLSVLSHHDKEQLDQILGKILIGAEAH